MYEKYTQFNCFLRLRMRCAVNNCGNNNRKGNRSKWRYFHFPKDKIQLQKWIEFCQREMNTATACICNEHFTPDDFERNMQYELGFTRKNPTKLKPGSCPTIHGPQDKLSVGNARSKRGQVKKNKPVQHQDDDIDSVSKKPSPTKESNNSIDSVLLGCYDDLNDMVDSDSSLDHSDDIVEYTVSEMEEYSVANDGTTIRMELEIIDPLHPLTNSEEHMEIIDSESDSYVKHLESEVGRLKHQVFFLKHERKKLMNEIQNLRGTVRNAEDKESNSVETSENLETNGMLTKNKKRPNKKTVMIYSANIETIKKLR